jgi:hypothetical protein
VHLPRDHLATYAALINFDRLNPDLATTHPAVERPHRPPEVKITLLASGDEPSEQKLGPSSMDV